MIFFRIVRMSLTGGIVIVLVLLIRLFLARVPKIYRRSEEHTSELQSPA